MLASIGEHLSGIQREERVGKREGKGGKAFSLPAVEELDPNKTTAKKDWTSSNTIHLDHNLSVWQKQNARNCFQTFFCFLFIVFFLFVINFCFN